jgi:hypothetical protein
LPVEVESTIATVATASLEPGFRITLEATTTSPPRPLLVVRTRRGVAPVVVFEVRARRATVTFPAEGSGTVSGVAIARPAEPVGIATASTSAMKLPARAKRLGTLSR